MAAALSSSFAFAPKNWKSEISGFRPASDVLESGPEGCVSGWHEGWDAGGETAPEKADLGAWSGSDTRAEVINRL